MGKRGVISIFVAIAIIFSFAIILVPMTLSAEQISGNKENCCKVCRLVTISASEDTSSPSEITTPPSKDTSSQASSKSNPPLIIQQDCKKQCYPSCESCEVCSTEDLLEVRAGKNIYYIKNKDSTLINLEWENPSNSKASITFESVSSLNKAEIKDLTSLSQTSEADAYKKTNLLFYLEPTKEGSLDIYITIKYSSGEKITTSLDRIYIKKYKETGNPKCLKIDSSQKECNKCKECKEPSNCILRIFCPSTPKCSGKEDVCKNSDLKTENIFPFCPEEEFDYDDCPKEQETVPNKDTEADPDFYAVNIYPLEDPNALNLDLDYIFKKVDDYELQSIKDINKVKDAENLLKENINLADDYLEKIKSEGMSENRLKAMSIKAKLLYRWAVIPDIYNRDDYRKQADEINREIENYRKQKQTKEENDAYHIAEGDFYMSQHKYDLAEREYSYLSQPIRELFLSNLYLETGRPSKSLYTLVNAEDNIKNIIFDNQQQKETALNAVNLAKKQLERNLLSLIYHNFEKQKFESSDKLEKIMGLGKSQEWEAKGEKYQGSFEGWKENPRTGFRTLFTSGIIFVYEGCLSPFGNQVSFGGSKRKWNLVKDYENIAYEITDLQMSIGTLEIIHDKGYDLLDFKYADSEKRRDVLIKSFPAIEKMSYNELPDYRKKFIDARLCNIDKAFKNSDIKLILEGGSKSKEFDFVYGKNYLNDLRTKNLEWTWKEALVNEINLGNIAQLAAIELAAAKAITLLKTIPAVAKAGEGAVKIKQSVLTAIKIEKAVKVIPELKIAFFTAEQAANLAVYSSVAKFISPEAGLFAAVLESRLKIAKLTGIAEAAIAEKLYVTASGKVVPAITFENQNQLNDFIKKMKSSGIKTTENAFEYNGVRYLLNIKGKPISYSESLIGFMKRTELETMNAAKLSDAAAAKSETALAGKAAPLSEELVKKIKSGKFSEDEIQRLSDARRLLKENNLPALKPEQEQELLLSHHTANEIENKFQRICAKVRPLMKAGLSKEQIKLLGDNFIFGTPLEDALSKMKRVLKELGAKDSSFAKYEDDFKKKVGPLLELEKLKKITEKRLNIPSDIKETLGNIIGVNYAIETSKGYYDVLINVRYFKWIPDTEKEFGKILAKLLASNKREIEDAYTLSIMAKNRKQQTIDRSIEIIGEDGKKYSGMKINEETYLLFERDINGDFNVRGIRRVMSDEFKLVRIPCKEKVTKVVFMSPVDPTKPNLAREALDSGKMLSDTELISIAEKMGYRVVRKSGSSHRDVFNPAGIKITEISVGHSKGIKRGTLIGILKALETNNPSF